MKDPFSRETGEGGAKRRMRGFKRASREHSKVSPLRRALTLTLTLTLTLALRAFPSPASQERGVLRRAGDFLAQALFLIA